MDKLLLIWPLKLEVTSKIITLAKLSEGVPSCLGFISEIDSILYSLLVLGAKEIAVNSVLLYFICLPLVII